MASGSAGPRVAIVGGGVVGVSAAYYLRRAGARVTVLERGGLAAGASGACNGYVWLSTKKPGLHRELAQESIGLLTGFASQTGRSFELRRSGEMLLIDAMEQRPAADAFVDRQAAAGIEVCVLSAREVVARQPALDPASLCGAVYSPEGLLLNPLKLVSAYAAAAREAGAEIRLGVEVTAVELKGGRVSALRTSAGQVPADFVVNAAGAWAPALGAMAGVALPVTPQRGQIIVTERLPPLIGIPTLQFEYVGLKRDIPRLLDKTRSGVTCAVSQGVSGHVYLGSSKEFVGFDTTTTSETLAEIVRQAVRYYPGLARVRALRSYAGLRPFTADGLPLLGPVEAVEGLVIATGHGGDGISLGAVSGALVADFVRSGTMPARMAVLSPDRFAGPGGHATASLSPR